MATKIDKLSHLAIDPLAQHTLVLDMIEGGTDITLVDPTNPYVKLMEATAVTSASAVNEVVKADRKFFPNLAIEEDDLYPHIVGEDERHLFATPAYAFLRFYISMDSIKLHAEVDDNVYSAIIPKNSYITVDGIDLTLMNDLTFKIHEVEPNVYRSFVENAIGENPEDESGVGAIESAVVVDSANEPWLTFVAPLKQVTVTWLESIATKGLEFKVRVPLENNQYYASEVFTKSGVPIQKVFTDEYYDATTPSVYIQVLDNEVVYTIPRTFIDSGDINGVINIIIYTTKGKIHMPLSDYGRDDYKVNIFSSKRTGLATAAKNLDYYLTSNTAITGGVDRRRLKDMRAKIINRSCGRLQIPITEYQLKERFRFLGLASYKALDTVLERLYIVSKDSFQLPELHLKSLMYTYSNTFNFESTDITDHSKFYIDSKTTMIKPGAVFMNTNEIITAAPDTLLAEIDNLPISDKIRYFNMHNLLFTPFLYIVDNKELDVSSRVYDIDNPTLDYRTITAKNDIMEENVNVTWEKMIREDGHYILIFKLLGNDKYEEATDISLSIIFEAEFTTISYTAVVSEAMANHYVDTQDPFKDYFFITIPTDNYITRDNKLRVFNANHGAYEEFIDINAEATLIINRQSSSVIDIGGVNSEFLTLEEKSLSLKDTNVNIIGLTREKIKVNFGVELEYLWRYITPSYNKRKFVRYDSDLPLKYESDIFEPYEDGKTYQIVDGEVVYNKIHSKGENVLDENGDIIYKHRKGDIVLDSKDEPIIDGVAGVSRQLDIIMLEYSYKAFYKPKYTAYLKRHINDIVELVTKVLYNENQILLEQTRAVYRPLISNNLISEDDGNVLSPSVDLYFKSDATLQIDASEAYNAIGSILNRFISKRYIVINDIEKEIERVIGSNILSAKVYNVVKGDPSIIYLDSDGGFRNRYRLKKRVDISLDILYDFELNIVRI